MRSERCRSELDVAGGGGEAEGAVHRAGGRVGAIDVQNDGLKTALILEMAEALQGEGLAQAAALVVGGYADDVDLPDTVLDLRPVEAGQCAGRGVHGQEEAGRVEPWLLESFAQVCGS